MTNRALGALAALVLSLPAQAGVREVKLKLPLRPKLAVTGREKVSLAPFIVASKLSERKDAAKYKDVDLDSEFRRFLGKQLAKALKELGESAAFWKDLGSRTGADILLTGIVDFKVEDKSGYRAEEYVSRIDGRTYFRQVLVESTGFTFEVTMVALDGKTGLKLYQETFKDTKEKGRRVTDELLGLFENLFSLENQLLGLFVVRERDANRYLYD
jgi:hypothetical protein